MSTKLHRNPPFRAEHLGSLLRPDDLLKTRAAIDKGAASQQDLTPLEDAAIKEIVDLQLKLGFHPITDGEYRRHSDPLLSFSFSLHALLLLIMGGEKSSKLTPRQCSGAPSSPA